MSSYLYKNKKKKYFKNYPIISVVTCVLNGEKVLEKTIRNVTKQSYKNLEYIVVYTPSKDKTWDIIMKYSDKIDKIVMNSKVGIYQAFNAGLKRASGDWINYMNAGDYFFNKNTIKNVFAKKISSDIIYSGSIVDYPNFKRFIKPSKLSEIKWQMPFSHQSCFVKLKIHKKYPFKVKYSLAADYDLFYVLKLKKKKFYEINKTISVSMAFGIVDRMKILTIFQNYLISKSYRNFNIFDYSFYFSKILIFILTGIIKKFIPNFILLNLLKYKYQSV